MKKLKTKNILIDAKIYKDLVIYFTRYAHSKSIEMLSLYHHELIDEHDWRTWKKKYLMVDGYILNKVLNKTSKIKDIEHFDKTKFLIDTDDNELIDDITLKTVVILNTCIIKDADKFYQQLFLEEALLKHKNL